MFKRIFVGVVVGFISVFTFVTEVAAEEKGELRQHLESLSALNRATFVALGEHIIEHKDNVRVLTLGDGDLIAGFDILLFSGYNTEPEVTLSVLDVDMSGTFNVGDGMLLRGLAENLGFEYVDNGFQSIDYENQVQLATALQRFASDAEVVSSMGQLNEIGSRISGIVNGQSEVVNAAQKIVFGQWFDHVVHSNKKPRDFSRGAFFISTLLRYRVSHQVTFSSIYFRF